MSPGKRRVVVLAGAILLILASGLILALTGDPAIPRFLESMPRPNGYVRYVEAVEALTGDPKEFQDNPAEFVEQNRAALRLWREAVPLDAEAPAETYEVQAQGSPYSHHGGFLRLAHSARLWGGEMEKAGQVEEAAVIYLDIIRMGQAVEHGPSLNLVIGLAIERIGLQSLQTLLISHPEALSEQVIHELGQLNRARLKFEETLERDQYWSRRNLSAPQYLFWKFHPATKQAYPKMRAKREELSAEMRDAETSLRRAMIIETSRKD